LKIENDALHVELAKGRTELAVIRLEIASEFTTAVELERRLKEFKFEKRSKAAAILSMLRR
jgi:hypothetical protein